MNSSAFLLIYATLITIGHTENNLLFCTITLRQICMPVLWKLENRAKINACECSILWLM